MSIGDIVPWNWGRKKVPVRRADDSFSSMRRQMNDLFDNFLSGDWEFPSAFAGESGSFVPKINVKDGEKELIVTAELPGMTQDQVNIELTDDALILKGEKRETREEKDEKTSRYYSESRYGSFQRIVPLYSEVDPDKVDAGFKNGILTVKLPKSSRAQSNSRKVSIRAE